MVASPIKSNEIFLISNTRYSISKIQFFTPYCLCPFWSGIYHRSLNSCSSRCTRKRREIYIGKINRSVTFLIRVPNSSVTRDKFLRWETSRETRGLIVSEIPGVIKGIEARWTNKKCQESEITTPLVAEPLTLRREPRRRVPRSTAGSVTRLAIRPNTPKNNTVLRRQHVHEIWPRASSNVYVRLRTTPLTYDTRVSVDFLTSSLVGEEVNIRTRRVCGRSFFFKHQTVNGPSDRRVFGVGES